MWMGNFMKTHTELLFPPFRMDVANERLWKEEQAIPLRPKTFAILRHLAEHPGRLVTKDELLRAVWGETRVSEEGLRDYVREIRQALQDDAEVPQFVETVQGRGYRFLPAVTTQPVQSSKFRVQSPQHPAPNTQHPSGGGSLFSQSHRHRAPSASQDAGAARDGESRATLATRRQTR
jgi:DNA-binding winged helix-turn-helix (wHTH) protein